MLLLEKKPYEVFYSFDKNLYELIKIENLV